VVDIRPFRALRTSRADAVRVAAPPYDVVTTAEARVLAAGNPDCFLHVSRPEIDLPDTVDPHSDEVYAAGRHALDDLLARGVLVADAEPAYSVYRQRMGRFEQTGIVGVVAVADYDAGRVAIHEHTRPDKEQDRVRHIDALGAQDEPVFLLAAPSPPIAAVVDAVTTGAPVADFTSDDGVTHTVWRVDDAAHVATVTQAFADLPRVYVADGHHRSAAASRVAAMHPGDGGQHWFLAVVFPSDEVHVMAYNRVVDLGAHTVGELLSDLLAEFEVSAEDGAVEPAAQHEFGMYADGQWYRLRLRPGSVDGRNQLARLDVSVLQDRVLAPLLGIGDPRTDTRLTFVGGIRGTGELQRLVDEAGGTAVAFSLHPTSTAELMAIADAREVMPPKSTWFEPKLRSGLFVHRF
jgi:uncharacterized protein (DUF1015 family)